MATVPGIPDLPGRYQAGVQDNVFLGMKVWSNGT
jgi:hypothetical protein